VEHEIIDLLSSKDHAVALVRSSATHKGGRSIAGRSVYVFRMENGRIAEVWLYGDAVPFAEFWDEAAKHRGKGHGQ
jgi:hypothetical protein